MSVLRSDLARTGTIFSEPKTRTFSLENPSALISREHIIRIGDGSEKGGCMVMVLRHHPIQYPHFTVEGRPSPKRLSDLPEVVGTFFVFSTLEG